MTVTQRQRRDSAEGQRAARISMRLLWWAPLSMIVGFILASWFLSESWPTAQVVPLAVILATPFGIGAYHGFRAVRSGERRGFVGLALHLVGMGIALVMPLTQIAS